MKHEEEQKLSLYVHIPFCKRKCNYCDFLSFSAKKEEMAAYFDALKKEIRLSAIEFEGYGVRSIFFGGGTPSFPGADLICSTLSEIKKSFDVCDDAEISIEVNPQSAILEKLVKYRDAGFNRLSIGAQSMNDAELKSLGRLHDSRMFTETFENARKAGFDNINVDVMSALPGQKIGSYMDTLEKIVSLHPEHISAYSLIVEEGTPFFDMDLDLPSEDEDREMYHQTKRFLAENGYHRYEISNYARNVDSNAAEKDELHNGHINLADTDGAEKYECYHNKVYWRRGNYLGLGLGASSMAENVRWNNVRDMSAYLDALNSSERDSIKDNNAINDFADIAAGNGALNNPDPRRKYRENIEVLSTQSQMEEFMFLGLRLVKGVSTSEFKSLFGTDIRDIYGNVIDKYIKMGLLEFNEVPKSNYTNTVEDTASAIDSSSVEEYLRLTDSGLDVSNTVMADFLL